VFGFAIPIFALVSAGKAFETWKEIAQPACYSAAIIAQLVPF
jgi:hypothetical protein